MPYYEYEIILEEIKIIQKEQEEQRKQQEAERGHQTDARGADHHLLWPQKRFAGADRIGLQRSVQRRIVKAGQAPQPNGTPA